MKRRTLLGTGLGVMAVAGSTARAQDAVTLSMVTDRPEAGRALAARLAAVTGGAIQISVTESAATEAAGFLETVSSGGADMYLSAEEAFIDTNPAFGIYSAMPGGMGPSELEGWLSAGDGRFLLDLMGEEYGVKSFMIGDDGPMPMWSKAPLSGLGDLTGAAVGSIGLGVLALRAMGVSNVVDIRAQDVDLASLDAFEGLSVSQMDAEGLLATFPHMTTPNAGRPSSALSVGINLATWNALSDADKSLLERSIIAEHGMNRTITMHDSAVALQAAGAAITNHMMPDDIWDAQIAAANQVMSDIFASSNLGADVADGYLYFIGDVAGWSEIGETAFVEARKGALAQ
jgi:TRAP-type mannitol/chloroaromatic compound transport system substrate-binding protein